MTDHRMLAVFADPVAPELARSLDLAGYAWKAIASTDEAAEHEPADGWHGAIIDTSGDAESAWAFANKSVFPRRCRSTCGLDGENRR